MIFKIQRVTLPCDSTWPHVYHDVECLFSSHSTYVFHFKMTLYDYLECFCQMSYYLEYFCQMIYYYLICYTHTLYFYLLTNWLVYLYLQIQSSRPDVMPNQREGNRTLCRYRNFSQAIKCFINYLMWSTSRGRLLKRVLGV